MRKLKIRGLIPLLIIGAIAATARLFPKATQHVIAAAGANTPNDTFPDSEYYWLVDGSVYDGDTLRVRRCEEHVKS